MASLYAFAMALGLAAAQQGNGSPTASTSPTDSGSPTATTSHTSSSSAAAFAVPTDYSDPYAHWLLAGLFAFAFLVFVWRVTLTSLKHFRHLVSLTHDKQNYFRKPHAELAWFKEHILYAPLFRKRHTNEMRITRWWGVGILPTRIQAIVLALIIIANLTLCLHNIPWNAPSAVMLPLLRNRTGVMATVNCIPLVIFAGRNNPFIKLLNISFDNFNLLHRWFGRIVVIEAFCHGLAWALSHEKNGDWSVVAEELVAPSLLINTGTIALIAFLIIPIQASSLLRHAFYETFLHLHQGLVITAFVGVWYHLKALPESVYIKSVIVAWAIDRLLRFAILIYCNFGKTRTSAAVEALPGDAVRVTLNMARPWKFRPGQHLYLTIPSIGLWTSHPFSVAWSSEEPTSAVEMVNKGFPTGDAEKGLAGVSADPVLSGSKTHSVSVVIRGRSGFTGSLLKKAQTSQTGRVTLSALVEGPYGNPHSMASYGTVLLFAGGVGITHAMPYVRSLVAGSAGHTVATRRVTLVWIIQSPEYLEWIRPWMTQVLAMEGRRDVLRIEIFITRPRSAREVRSPSSTVRMFAGRPAVGEIIARETQAAVGALGVGVCGPGGLGDDVRKGVRDWCQVGEVDLLEESFSW